MLFDARMINYSGIGTYIKALLPGFCSTFNATVLTNDASCSLPVDTGNSSIVEFSAPIYSIKEQLKYPTLTEKHLFFSPHYNSPLLPVRAKHRVVTIHDVFHLAHFKQLSLAQKLYAKLVINRSVSLSDSIITVSEFSKNEIIRYTGCKPEKITVIHNGVKQTASPLRANEVRKKYALPDKYLLYVGNVKPHKNLNVFLEAYMLLSAGIKKEYKIVIAGKKDGFITGDNTALEFIDKTESLKSNVVFTGYVEDMDMDTLYAEAALLVFPSFYEGFGLPPLEAMLNKCPVISSNAASLPEVCGNAAAYFDPLDKEDLAGKITKTLLAADFKTELVNKGVLHVKKFTWQASVEKHIEIFRSLQ